MDVLCHTGGPKVLREVARGLSMEEPRANEALASSWAVMREHGNLSGASNLAVLDHYNRNFKCKAGEFNSTVDRAVFCLSMGPGVCMEGLICVRKAAGKLVDSNGSMDYCRDRFIGL